MTAKAKQGGGDTSFSNTDWDAYIKARPQYPQSLIDLVYAYRQKQPNARWKRIVDIGAGIGIGATLFAKDFEIIHLSDPSPANGQSSTSFLSTWLSHNGINAKVEISQSMGEEAYKHVPEADTDLVICATAAHFIDPDGLAASAAKLLRPGGTLAFFSYWAPTFPTKEMDDKYWEAIGNLIKLIRSMSDEKFKPIFRRVVQNVCTGGLDYIPLPDEYYTNKERVLLNSANGELLYDGIMARHFMLPEDKAGESRRLPNEKIVGYYTGRDKEANGWQVEADKAFLINFLDTLRPYGSPVSDEQFAEVHAEFDKVFDKECPSGKVTTLWPANLLLATRK